MQPAQRQNPDRRGSTSKRAIVLGAVLIVASACSSESERASGDRQDQSARAGAGNSAGSDGAGATSGCTREELLLLDQQLQTALDAAAQDPKLTNTPDLTLLLESSDGRRFVHSHGMSSPTTAYESASTSKLVTAVVILDLVAQGMLSLQTKPHELLSFWSAESEVTLRHLLSFTSGFDREACPRGDASCLASCVNLPNADFEQCVKKIYDHNVELGVVAPGTHFFYSSTHLQIAGLMAMKATKQTWAQIFDTWKAKTQLFSRAAYDLPSLTNPRLAGGMHWNGEEYVSFLNALFNGRLLSSALREELFANQRGSAIVAASPSIQLNNEDWAYGFGNWLECPTAIGENTFDCATPLRNSSPGAYGAYPFIDFQHEYVGILARQGELGTFHEGLNIFRAIADDASRWATKDCD